MSIKIKSLALTCGAFPSQWEGETTDKRIVYIRYRFGKLGVYIAKNMKAVLRMADDCYQFSLNSGHIFSGELTTVAMLQALKSHLDFSQCKIKPDNIIFYKFTSSKTEDFEISNDRMKIHQWEKCEVITEEQFHAISANAEIDILPSTEAIMELGLKPYVK